MLRWTYDVGEGGTELRRGRVERWGGEVMTVARLVASLVGLEGVGGCDGSILGPVEELTDS